jgi:hypothetical protein
MNRALLAGFLVIMAAATASAQTASPDCTRLIERFNAIVALYAEEGKRAIGETGDVAEALEKARQTNLKGDARASIRVVGISLAMRLSSERFSVSTIRQICTFADRNSLPLHVLACAYFTGLNPLGSLDDKRAMVERQLERFAALGAEPFQPGEQALLNEHAKALGFCLSR